MIAAAIRIHETWTNAGGPSKEFRFSSIREDWFLEMKLSKHQLRDGRVLVIREAAIEDAHVVLDYIESISAESDFLSFGPGEF